MSLDLFDAVLSHSFAEDQCFLCGETFTADTGTEEHVFPKWLQRMFGLWNAPVHLLNGTTIPYRQLVIPCCNECNNDHLAALEDRVCQAVTSGPEAVRQLDRLVLMQWLMKIFYGLVYRELFLPLDRRAPDQGSIVSSTDMEQFQILHYMLQSVRVPMNFEQPHSDIPASIFVFEVQERAEPEFKFDYKDDVVHRALYLLLGRVGILASFDTGAQTTEGAEYFPQYQKEMLHPVQFAELGASLFLKATKFARNPKIMFAEGPRHVNFMVMPFTWSPNRPVFEASEPFEMAKMMSFFMRAPVENFLIGEDGRVTYLHDAQGKFQFIPLYPATIENA